MLLSNPIKIRPLVRSDWQAVKTIYQQGIDTGLATFETEVPDWFYWDQKYHTFCRLVALDRGQVVGWATLAPVSARPVYRGVAEVSVYVATEARGKGIGLALLNHLVKSSEEAGVWTLQSSVFPENEASISIHKKSGFRVVGIREKIGQRDGLWRDNVFMERRSALNG